MNRINPYQQHELPSIAICPNCNTKLDLTTEISGNHPDNKKPVPGDISLCLKCATPCQFGEYMEMVKLTDERMKEAMKDPSLVNFILFIQEAREEKQKYDYEQQLDCMLSGVKKWIKSNPDKTICIQYNFNSETCVIASLDEALDKHFISVNEDASVMFKELGWLDNELSMPTVLMVKVVMDRVFKEDE